jgi:hypothetical protein
MAQPHAIAPASSVVPVAPPVVVASKRIWGIDWQSVGPWTFDDVVAEAVAFDEAAYFMRDHYAALFETETSAFLQEPMTEAKKRFCAEMDVFVFRAQSRVVGLLLCSPSDWSTYYVRSTAMLPAFRDRRLPARLSVEMEPVLAAAGVKRMEAECAPANLPMMRIMSSLGYVITGTHNSERWGNLLRWTKYLDDASRAVFMRQFSAMSFQHVTRQSECSERRTT